MRDLSSLCVRLFGVDVAYQQLSDDLSKVGIAQIVAHTVSESIFCCEGWQCGSSQMSMERTCGSSSLDIGRIIGNFHFALFHLETLGLISPVMGGQPNWFP